VSFPGPNKIIPGLAHKSSSELFFLSNLVLGFRVISKITVAGYISGNVIFRNNYEFPLHLCALFACVWLRHLLPLNCPSSRPPRTPRAAVTVRGL
jgi:hypothetical protein